MSNCEGRPKPATTSDDGSIPLCAACRDELVAEANAAPAIIGHNRGFEGGYESGFADALNETVPDLIRAARDLLRVRDRKAFKALAEAISALPEEFRQ